MQTAVYETTGFLVETETTRVLIDCGPGLVRQLLRAGVELESLDALVLTHSHADHTGSATYLCFSASLEKAAKQISKPFSLIGTSSILDGFHTMAGFQYPTGFPALSLRDVPASSFEASEIVVGDLSLTTIPVKHSVEAIGVRISSGGAAVTYSSDTVFSEALCDLAAGSRVLMHEAFCTSENADMAQRVRHSTAREAGQAAARVDPESLLLMHPLPPHRVDPTSLIREAAMYFHGTINVPQELEVLEFQ